MKKMAYVHIGTEKTGSTSIQESLFQNKEILKNNGFYYYCNDEKDRNSKYITYFCLANAKQDEFFLEKNINTEHERIKFKEKYFDEFDAEMNRLNNSIHTIIISSEHLHSMVNTIDEIKHLFHLLNKYFTEIKIICYVREQAFTCQSQYSTSVKWGTHKPIDNYLKNCNSNNIYYNYYEMLMNWANVFGKENITVRLFDKNSLINNDVVDDFFSIIDHQLLSAVKKIEHKNVSLNHLGQYFARATNSLLPRYNNTGTLNKAREYVINYLSESFKGKTEYLFQDDYDKIYFAFEESNKKLNEVFLSGQKDQNCFSHYKAKDKTLPIIQEDDMPKIVEWLKVLIQHSKIKQYVGVEHVTNLHAPEPWGRWSNGDIVRIFPETTHSKFVLHLDIAHVFAENAKIPFVIRVGLQEKTLCIPKNGKYSVLFENVDKNDFIEIRIPKAQSPKELGMSSDTRKLGIGFANAGIRIDDFSRNIVTCTPPFSLDPYIDALRDAAIQLESKDMNFSLKLMKLAQELRPNGPFIKQKIKDYQSIISGKKQAPDKKLDIKRVQTTLSCDFSFLKKGESPTLEHIGSQLCTREQFDEEIYKYWCTQLNKQPRLHRKQWEYVYLLQALNFFNMLKEGKRGLVFACGREPLPSVFATKSMYITATDINSNSDTAEKWSATNQHADDLSSLYYPKICSQEILEKYVNFKFADMNNITHDLKEDYDFAYSLCALEHLGSLEKGLNFIENSLQCVKKGGIVVHTTEFNLSSNTETVDTGKYVLYRMKDIKQFADKMEKNGYKVFGLNFSVGNKFSQQYINTPPFTGHEHLMLFLKGYVVTSIGLIIQK